MKRIKKRKHENQRELYFLFITNGCNYWYYRDVLTINYNYLEVYQHVSAS